MPVSNAERAYLLARLERLHTLVDRLETMTSDLARLREMRRVLLRELLAAKKAVKQLARHPPARQTKGARSRR
jgi:hypothetical protein